MFYENLLPGSQLVNRLQDLGYRVHSLNDIRSLVMQARQERPLVVLTDLGAASADVCSVIRELKKKNTITILTTHDRSQAERLADRALTIREKKLIEI